MGPLPDVGRAVLFRGPLWSGNGPETEPYHGRFYLRPAMVWRWMLHGEGIQWLLLLKRDGQLG